MATAKELRMWASTIRQWAAGLDDNLAFEYAVCLAAELDDLATCADVYDRQLV
jgi:hypothetical protein